MGLGSVRESQAGLGPGLGPGAAEYRGSTDGETFFSLDSWQSRYSVPVDTEMGAAEGAVRASFGLGSVGEMEREGEGEGEFPHRASSHMGRLSEGTPGEDEEFFLAEDLLEILNPGETEEGEAYHHPLLQAQRDSLARTHARGSAPGTPPAHLATASGLGAPPEHVPGRPGSGTGIDAAPLPSQQSTPGEGGKGKGREGQDGVDLEFLRPPSQMSAFLRAKVRDVNRRGVAAMDPSALAAVVGSTKRNVAQVRGRTFGVPLEPTPTQPEQKHKLTGLPFSIVQSKHCPQESIALMPVRAASDKEWRVELLQGLGIRPVLPCVLR